MEPSLIKYRTISDQVSKSLDFDLFRNYFDQFGQYQIPNSNSIYIIDKPGRYIPQDDNISIIVKCSHVMIDGNGKILTINFGSVSGLNCLVFYNYLYKDIMTIPMSGYHDIMTYNISYYKDV